MIKKYVIVRGNPILFSAEIIHADMVKKLKGIESAGFFLITNDKGGKRLNVICIGESTSLSIRSRPEIDQKIIADFLELDNYNGQKR